MKAVSYTHLRAHETLSDRVCRRRQRQMCIRDRYNQKYELVKMLITM